MQGKQCKSGSRLLVSAPWRTHRFPQPIDLLAQLCLLQPPRCRGFGPDVAFADGNHSQLAVFCTPKRPPAGTVQPQLPGEADANQAPSKDPRGSASNRMICPPPDRKVARSQMISNIVDGDSGCRLRCRLGWFDQLRRLRRWQLRRLVVGETRNRIVRRQQLDAASKQYLKPAGFSCNRNQSCPTRVQPDSKRGESSHP
jgi:hypothetical protein